MRCQWLQRGTVLPLPSVNVTSVQHYFRGRIPFAQLNPGSARVKLTAFVVQSGLTNVPPVTRPQSRSTRIPRGQQYATRWWTHRVLGHPQDLHNLVMLSISPRSLPFIPFPFPMPSAESVRPASYVPCRFASGTFPVSRNYYLRQMLYNYSYSKGRDDSKRDPSDQVIPSFPFSDVPVYADTVDIESESCMSAH